MNILVIGNGFDKAHNLPTSYNDFLDYIMIVNNCSEQDIHRKDQFYIQVKDFILENHDILDEFKKLVYNNLWIKYFLERRKYLVKKEKINWIDFEGEISYIIQILDSLMKEIKKSHSNSLNDTEIVNFLPTEKDKCYNLFIKDFFDDKLDFYDEITEGYDHSLKSKNLLRLKKKTLEDLNRLTRALEIYLCTFIEKQEIRNKLSDIRTLEIDRVLSFNYTSTYDKVYADKNKIEFDYIHGKADIKHDQFNCPIILGIDEYNDENEKDENIYFVEFKKFYQRILKGSGCKYKKWLEPKYDHVSNMKDINEVYFFGHSLDVTDKDIISEIILSENMYTTIFYRNQNDLSSKIINLVKVIGQDKLIEMTSEPNRQIWFQKITANDEKVSD